MKNILVILGTRPEAIKLSPVILELRKEREYRVFVCNTEQQKELSNQALEFFGIRPDFNLDAMLPNQTLAGVQSRIFAGLSGVFAENRFDAAMVQGDTMSVLCGALVSFYCRVPVFHVEAGLRSHDLSEPFPEEAVRQMTARVANLHFAPTPLARDSLIREGIPPERISVTGNTGIDALSCLPADAIAAAGRSLVGRTVRLDDELVLVTMHRRENHGERLASILDAITRLSVEFSAHQFVVPVHPNPNVYGKVHAALEKIENVVLTPPLSYPELVCVMKNAKLILTDSGGIQEEAPTFGVPVLVMRQETERTEGVTAGFAKLVGADCAVIVHEAGAVLTCPKRKTALSERKNPYGDGHAAERITRAVRAFFAEGAG